MKAEAQGGEDVSVCRCRSLLPSPAWGSCLTSTEGVHLEGAAREGGKVMSPELQPEELLSPVPLWSWLCPRGEQAGQLQLSPARVVGSTSWDGSSAPPHWGWDSPVWIQH